MTCRNERVCVTALINNQVLCMTHCRPIACTHVCKCQELAYSEVSIIGEH